MQIKTPCRRHTASARERTTEQGRGAGSSSLRGCDDGPARWVRPCLIFVGSKALKARILNGPCRAGPSQPKSQVSARAEAAGLRRPPSRSRDTRLSRVESTPSLASLVTADHSDGLRWRRPPLLAFPRPPKLPAGGQHAPAFSSPLRHPWVGGGAGNRTRQFPSRRAPPGCRPQRSPSTAPRFGFCDEFTFRLLLPYCEISCGSGEVCKLVTCSLPTLFGAR
jgi:hypothetical protein